MYERYGAFLKRVVRSLISKKVIPLVRGHAAGGAVGWGTALNARRPRVRFPIVSVGIFQ